MAIYGASTFSQHSEASSPPQGMQGQNLLINSDFRIAQRGRENYMMTSDYDAGKDEIYAVDRWCLTRNMAAQWSDHEDCSYLRVSIYREEGVAAPVQVQLRQYIEGIDLGDWYTVQIKLLEAGGLSAGKVFAATQFIPASMDARTGTFLSVHNWSVGWTAAPSYSSNVLPVLRLEIRIDEVETGRYEDGARNGLYLGWVKLERGKVATPYVHAPPGLEYAACQRYYRGYGAATVPAYVDEAGDGAILLGRNGMMRKPALVGNAPRYRAMPTIRCPGLPYCEALTAEDITNAYEDKQDANKYRIAFPRLPDGTPRFAPYATVLLEMDYGLDAEIYDFVARCC